MALPTISITGNVKKPELKYAQSGKAVHSFNLECADKNKDGSWDNLYIKVTTFDKTAEFVNQYFQEGSVAIVTGKLVTKVWEKADGTKQYDITLKFPNVEFAPKDKSGHQQEQPQPQKQHTDYQTPQGYGNGQNMPPQQQAIPDMDEDEIPF
jgi:single-strand DNA-binding protein